MKTALSLVQSGLEIRYQTTPLLIRSDSLQYTNNSDVPFHTFVLTDQSAPTIIPSNALALAATESLTKEKRESKDYYVTTEILSEHNLL